MVLWQLYQFRDVRRDNNKLYEASSPPVCPGSQYSGKPKLPVEIARTDCPVDPKPSPVYIIVSLVGWWLSAGILSLLAPAFISVQNHQYILPQILIPHSANCNPPPLSLIFCLLEIFQYYPLLFLSSLSSLLVTL